MTPKQAQEFHDALHAALNQVKAQAETDMDDKDAMEILGIINDCGSFQRMIIAGVDSHLIESGNGPINSEAKGDALKAEANRVVKMTAKEAKVMFQVAVSLGIDLGVALIREGAKFPGQVVN